LGHGHPSKFQLASRNWLRYCIDVAQPRSAELCRTLGRLLGCYTIGMYTFSGALRQVSLFAPPIIGSSAIIGIGPDSSYSRPRIAIAITEDRYILVVLFLGRIAALYRPFCLSV